MKMENNNVILPSENNDIANNSINSLNISSQRRISYRSGPLPTPEEMVKYNEAIPDAANRILIMAEKEQSFRHQSENRIIDKVLKSNSRGQILAFIIALLGMGIGAWLIYLGNTITGSVFSGATLITLVSLFIKGSNIINAERIQKQNLSELQEPMDKEV